MKTGLAMMVIITLVSVVLFTQYVMPPMQQKCVDRYGQGSEVAMSVYELICKKPDGSSGDLR